MLELNPQVIAWLSVIANLLVQLTKGLVPEALKKWIPLILASILSLIGLSLAAYTGRDPVAGFVEGFFGACGAIGLYEMASALPGVGRLWTSDGWIKAK